VFSIFLSKGFDLDFLKVVKRKINRKKRNCSNSSKGRKRAWDLAKWWECA